MPITRRRGPAHRSSDANGIALNLRWAQGRYTATSVSSVSLNSEQRQLSSEQGVRKAWWVGGKTYSASSYTCWVCMSTATACPSVKSEAISFITYQPGMSDPPVRRVSKSRCRAVASNGWLCQPAKLASSATVWWKYA